MNQLQPHNTQLPAVSAPSFLQKTGDALAQIQGNAAVMETMAAIYIAKAFPRDEAQVTNRMFLACSRNSLAEKAVYTYKRGGAAVTGPSIHLANALLGAWGNAEAGWKEIGRHVDNSKKGQPVTVSECLAFCYDKETNTRSEIAFTVPHWRDRRDGGVALTEERDIYEICANMASRRMRACILRILPAWLVEEALDRIERTKNGDGKKPMADRIRNMEAQFSEIGVNKKRLEAYLGHPLAETVAQELRTLGGVLAAIRDGEGRVSDYFPEEPGPDAKKPVFETGDEIPGLELEQPLGQTANI